MGFTFIDEVIPDALKTLAPVNDFITSANGFVADVGARAAPVMKVLGADAVDVAQSKPSAVIRDPSHDQPSPVLTPAPGVTAKAAAVVGSLWSWIKANPLLVLAVVAIPGGAALLLLRRKKKK